ISRPIAPKVSCGVGSAGITRCGGGGGAGSCAPARLAQASNATTVMVRCMPAIISSPKEIVTVCARGRGENEELEHAVNDHESAHEGGRAERGPQPETLFED